MRFGSRLLAVFVCVGLVFGPRTVQAKALADSSGCDLYVDSNAAIGGDGSAGHPWNAIPTELSTAPGQKVCIRGNATGPGRIYNTPRIVLRSDGTAVAPSVLRAYPGEQVTLVGLGAGPLINILGDYWTVEVLTIDNNRQTGPALRIAETASFAVVRQNDIRNGRYNGVEMAGTDSRVEANQIHHFDAGDSDAECIQVFKTSDRAVIRSNTIHDCSGNGIELYYPSDILVDLTDVADHVQILNNVLYRGTTTRAEVGIGIKAGTYITVSGNGLSGYTDHPAADVHRLSQHVLFDGNRIHDSERGISIFTSNGQTPENTIVSNNLIHGISDPVNGYGIQISGAVAPMVFHNTLVNVVWRSISIGANGMVGGAVRNNLVVNSGPARASRDAALQNVVFSNNGWFDSATSFSSGSDTVGHGDPGFVDTVHGDYHLEPNSRALDSGIGVGVFVDFEGDQRPIGAAPDLGADEYVPPLWLRTAPRDGGVRLDWTGPVDPNLASYAIVYVVAAGASSASEGASPIANLSVNTHSFTLTGLTNYKRYVFYVVSRDGSGVNLLVSNTVTAIPTNRFVFLPTVARNSP